MQLWLLNNFSPALLILFFTLICITLSLSTYKLSRRYFPGYLSEFFADNTYFYRILITSSTILFAFTMIVLWQTLISAKDSVSKEANSLSGIILNSNAFPSQERIRIRTAVHQYIQALMYEEWPLMQKGRSSAATENALDNVYNILKGYSPKTTTEQIFYRDCLMDFGEAYEARHVRLEKLESIIPAPLQAIIMLDMFLLIFVGALLNPKEKRSHVMLMMVINVLIGANLAFITAFDYPFSGDISVSSKPFTLGVLAEL